MLDCGGQFYGAGWAGWIGVVAILGVVVLARDRGFAADAIGETVTVRAAPVRETEKLAPTAFADQIDPSTYSAEMESVADAVSDSVGVSVRRYGGLGAFSTLSVRGASANQVQVYLDGVPLSRAQNEVVNFADLPLDSLERIEIYRGTTPLSLGVAGIGGVVNLVPKSPGEKPYSHASLGYGSFTTRKASLTRVQRLGSFDVFASATWLGSAGNFRYHSDNDTPLNPLDDREVTRVHNSFDSVATLLRLRRRAASPWQLDVLQETFWKANDLPGRGANPSLHATADRLRLVHAARWQRAEWPFRISDFEPRLFTVFERTGFRDPFGELGAGQQRRQDDSVSAGGNVRLALYPRAAHLLDVFLETTGETYLPHNAAPNAPREPDATRWRATAGIQHQWEAWPDHVRLVPALRVESLWDRSHGALRTFGRTLPALSRHTVLWSPSIGIEWRLLADLRLRANLGRYRRAPNFTELFGNTGSVLGNPQLVPERAWNRDLGTRFQYTVRPWPLQVEGEYAYFHNDVEQLIVFVQRSAAVFKPENVGRARLRGHEFGLRSRWRNLWVLDANYTLQEAENRSLAFGGIYVGKRLPGRPREELYLRASVTADRFSPYYELSYTSGNFLDQANFDRVPARTVHTLGVSVTIGWGVSVGLQARNLTGNQIADVAGFPLPGRTLFVTVAWHDAPEETK